MSKGLLDMMKAASTNTSSGQRLLDINVSDLYPIESQDRKSFDTSKLEEMAASFRERIAEAKIPNIIPLHVSVGEDGKYMIQGGERRWRTAKLVGYEGPLTCLIVDSNEKELSDIMFLSNYAREDLNLVELSHAIGSRIDAGIWDRPKAMSLLGYSKGVLSKILAIRELPDDVQQLCLDGIRTDKDFLIDLGRIGDDDRKQLIEKLRAGDFDSEDAKNLRALAVDSGNFKTQTKEPKTRKPTKLSLRAAQLRLIVANSTAIRKAMKPLCQNVHKHANLDSISDGDFVEYFDEAINQLVADEHEEQELTD